MSRIPWADVPEPKVEQMIAVLLSHLHQGEAARIDGRGGDGGRDVQIATERGIRAFEIKSFTGRMTASRRSKAQASLKRAANLAPIDWTLLVPIDHNPKELEWFEWLQTTVPFPITWRGLTWLETEFAQRPFIARHYLEGTLDELAAMTRLFNQEKAALAGGAPDVMDRARDLVQRANELDPHYRFEVTSDGATTSTKVIPRYPGAERDRPITGGFNLQFPNDEAGRKAADDFQRALDFGTGFAVPEEYVKEATFDAPSNLGGRFENARIELLPSRPSRKRLDLVLAITDSTDLTLSEVPVALKIMSSGDRGSILRGTDRTGTMTVNVTLDGRQGSMDLKFVVRSVPFFPSEMRPLAKFLAETAKPNFLVVRTPDGDRIGRVAFEDDEPLGAREFPQMVEDLALLQWASGMTRRVGPQLEYDDAVALGIASELLRGARIELSWTEVKMRLYAEAPEENRRSILNDEFPVVLRTPQPHVAQICGVSYPIGNGMEVEILSGRLAPGHGDWREAGIVPAGAEVTLVPGSSNKALAQLITR